jgi:hypothetical protein
LGFAVAAAWSLFRRFLLALNSTVEHQCAQSGTLPALPSINSSFTGVWHHLLLDKHSPDRFGFCWNPALRFSPPM